MTDKKEIEKMARVIDPCSHKDCTSCEARGNWRCSAYSKAQDLYKNGYGDIRQAVKEFGKKVQQIICECTVPDFNKEGKPISRFVVDGYKQIDKLIKEFKGAGVK